MEGQGGGDLSLGGGGVCGLSDSVNVKDKAYIKAKGICSTPLATGETGL